MGTRTATGALTIQVREPLVDLIERSEFLVPVRRRGNEFPDVVATNSFKCGDKGL